MDILESINKSKGHFIDDVFPHIRESIGNGEIIEVEGISADLHRILDVYSGVDLFQLIEYPTKNITGIASRVQYADNGNGKYTDWINYGKTYDTITIRYSIENHIESTEYYKKMYAIKNEGLLYPKYTVHAYVDSRLEGNKAVSIIVVYTKQLYLWIEKMIEDNQFVESWSNKQLSLYWNNDTVKKRMLMIPFDLIDSSCIVYRYKREFEPIQQNNLFKLEEAL